MKTKTKLFGMSWRLWALVLALVAVAVFTTLRFAHVFQPFGSGSHSTAPPYSPGLQTKTGGQNTKGTSTAPSIVQSNPAPKGSAGSQGGATSNAPLAAPAGNFVNAHKVSTTTQMFSVCNTTPGATCQITFTNMDTRVVKSLQATTTDSGGAAYWSWTPKSIGMNGGTTWEVTATAKLNNQTKSTNDAANLEVN